MSERPLTEGGVGTLTGARASSGPGTPAAPPDAEEAVAACPECATAFVGDYCHRCGEKRPEARDLSVRRFLHDAAKELTSLDSKLLRTVRALLFRPGLLTVEWVRGRRSHYLKPLNLCLGVFALSLFAYSAYKPVAMFDVSNIAAQDRAGSLVKLISHVAEKKHAEPGAITDQMSERWQRFMSLSPVVLVFAFAVALQLVFLLTRRYFVEHLVFAMHFVSFSMLLMVLMWPVYFFVGIKSGGAGTAVAAGRWLLDLAYMFFAVRAVYRLGTARTLLASVPLVAGYFASYVLVFASTMILAVIAVALW